MKCSTVALTLIIILKVSDSFSCRQSRLTPRRISRWSQTAAPAAPSAIVSAPSSTASRWSPGKRPTNQSVASFLKWCTRFAKRHSAPTSAEHLDQNVNAFLTLYKKVSQEKRLPQIPIWSNCAWALIPEQSLPPRKVLVEHNWCWSYILTTGHISQHCKQWDLVLPQIHIEVNGVQCYEAC